MGHLVGSKLVCATFLLVGIISIIDEMLSSEGAVKGLAPNRVRSLPLLTTFSSHTVVIKKKEFFKFFFFLILNFRKRPAMGGLIPKKVVPHMPAEWLSSADDVLLVINMGLYPHF